MNIKIQNRLLQTVLYAVGLLLLLSALTSVTLAQTGNSMPNSPVTNQDEMINVCQKSSVGYTQSNFPAGQLVLDKLNPNVVGAAIIPPFNYDFGNDASVYDGMNWDLQEIWNNDCVLPQVADMRVTKVADRTTPTVGDMITYNITLDNIGTGVAEGILLTDTLQSGLTFHSAVPPFDSSRNPQGWEVGTMQSGASLSFQVLAIVDAGQEGNTLTNSASVDTEVDETSYENNLDSADVTVAQGDTSLDEPEVATVVAQKIVCDDESYLPDWAPDQGVPAIDENTANDFLAEDDNSEHCQLERWNFEWAPPSVEGNPGDNNETAGDPWTAFSGSVEIEVQEDWEHVWVREVPSSNYIPFTGKADIDTVSAEMYCNIDSYHYDNYERVDGITADETYYCVAWNVPIKRTTSYTCDTGLLFLDTETDSPEISSLYTVDESDGEATFFAEYELTLFPVLAVSSDETIYTIEKGTGDLLTLDDDSGAYTVVGATGINSEKPVAMEFAPDGTLYALTENTNALYEINPANGVASKLHDLDLNVSGGDVVFDSSMIIYVRNTGEVYSINASTYDEAPLGTLSVGNERITSAATKNGVHYAYTRGDGFYPFTLYPFTEETPILETGPFAWGDGSYCPAVKEEPETEEITICKIDGSAGEGEEGSLYTLGWNMTLTNDVTTYELTTDETGCVTQEVDPTDGPWTATEENVAGWELVHIDAAGGIQNTQDTAPSCTFFSAPVGIEYARTKAEATPTQGDEHTCTFVNAQRKPGPYDECREPNLLINGSFEDDYDDNNVVDSGNGWAQLSAIAGWATKKVDALFELHFGWSGNKAAAGEQYAELDSTAPTTISQSVTLEEGAEYKLWWAFAPRQNTSADENNLSVLVDGIQVATEGPLAGTGVLDDEDWIHNSYTFFGDGNDIDIAFKDLGNDSNVNNVNDPDVGTFLDDTYLCKISEPVDVCDNLEGDQEVLPEGYEFSDENICTPIKEDGGSGSSSTSGGGGCRNCGDDDEPEGETQGDSDTRETDEVDEPEEEVQGEQTSKVPAGAPDTGAGGTSSTPLSSIPFALFLGVVASFGLFRYARVNG